MRKTLVMLIVLVYSLGSIQVTWFYTQAHIYYNCCNLPYIHKPLTWDKLRFISGVHITTMSWLSTTSTLADSLVYGCLQVVQHSVTCQTAVHLSKCCIEQPETHN